MSSLSVPQKYKDKYLVYTGDENATTHLTNEILRDEQEIRICNSMDEARQVATETIRSYGSTPTPVQIFDPTGKRCQ